MEKAKRTFSIRVKPEIIEKILDIEKTTRYSKSAIIERWVLGTQVDPVTKEFITNCSSTGPITPEKKE